MRKAHQDHTTQTAQNWPKERNFQRGKRHRIHKITVSYYWTSHEKCQRTIEGNH